MPLDTADDGVLKHAGGSAPKQTEKTIIPER